MPKNFKAMSRNHQKFIYVALINNYASYLQSKDKNPVSMDDEVYWKWKAKDELKKLYCKATKDIREEKPLETFQIKLKETLTEIIPKDYNLESKVDIITNDITYNLRDFLSDLALELGKTEYFSLALRSCSNEKAIAFTKFCIDYYLDNEIPIDEKLRESIVKSEHDHYIYACLKNKVCCVCGTKNNIEFEHYHTIASTCGTYSKDNGTGDYWSLCHNCHTEKHQISLSEHYKKYGIKGIFLTPEQIPIIKKIYNNHFKNYKGEL